jgi:hypothetical protein
MNTFGDWRETDSLDEISAIQIRAQKMQQLLHLFQPSALSSIEHHQIIQITQNKQHTFDETILEPGTSVYLKVESLLGKLEPSYRGPYTIHKQVKNGNYQVKNLLGSVLKTIYPRHKLKIVAPDDIEDEHCEVERILKHRRSNETKKFKYFVKWKDLPDEENSWVNESDFDTVVILNKYWKTVNTSTKQVSLLQSFTPLHMLMFTLLCLILCCNSSTAKSIFNEELPFCDMAKTPTLIDVVRSCHYSKSSAQSRPPFFTKEIEHSLFYSPRYNLIAPKKIKFMELAGNVMWKDCILGIIKHSFQMK